jgi:hypothetical protein
VDHSCYFFYSSTISHFISLIFLTPLFLSFLSVLCEPTSSFTIRQLFLICCSWSDCYRLIPSILFLIRLYLLAYHCRRNRIIPNYPTRPLAIDRQSRRRLFACIFEPNSVSLAKKKNQPAQSLSVDVEYSPGLKVPVPVSIGAEWGGCLQSSQTY